MNLPGDRRFIFLAWTLWMMHCQSIIAQQDVIPFVVQLKNPNRSEHIHKTTRNISIVGDEFFLDGRPLHIMSGSLHYFRLPAAYWRDRLRKLKAAGLNAVSTYVEWSYHEPEERQYMFDGDRDVAQFVRIAAEEGLHVLLRPGPYICAERDLGGLPYWLLGKYQNIKLRTTDENFIHETKIWMAKLFAHLTPLLYGNGGPIILVQVENEYGSYGDSKPYMEKNRDILLEHVGTNALLYTTDGKDRPMFNNGAVSGALTTIDFGTVGSNMHQIFRPLRRFMPHGPLMNSEFYPGWLTHWGESLQQVDTNDILVTLRAMMDNKINYNFYMFFGGSNFEFSAGANYGGTYQPDITSYDYDAPLSEAGDPTSKYKAIRNVLKEYSTEQQVISEPVITPKGAYGPLKVDFQLAILSPDGRSQLGRIYKEVTGSSLPTFERLQQRAGLLLFETTVDEGDGMLQITKPRDRVYVYLNGIFQGIISRMHKLYSLPLNAKPNSTLSLLVESQGRINFGPHIHDFKGIISTVTYNNKVLDGKWSILGYPLEELKISSSTGQYNTDKGPVIFEGYFTLPPGQEPLDTFLDPSEWGKGYIWVNGHNLGRYWPDMGPQVTLYLPGIWLHAAPTQNHIQVLELEKVSNNLGVVSIDYPILNRTGSSTRI